MNFGNALNQIELGEMQVFKNLCVAPLFDGPDQVPDYLSLKEALDRKQVEITEASEGGSVPNLKVKNKSDQPVLMVDGEELIGAKQNRIVNTSIMLEPKSETVIPVSCTEQGRWRYAGRQFRDSGVVMSSKARNKKNARIYRSLKVNQSYDARQGEVWSDIGDFHRRSGTSSATGAMKDAFIQKEKDIKEYLAAFPIIDGQKGLIVFLNGKIQGIDFISRHSAYKHLHEKLLKSHLAEAISEKTEKFDTVDLSLGAKSFLNDLINTSETTKNNAVGLGEDYRFDNQFAYGAALVYQQKLIHLAAFPKATIEEQEPPVERDFELRLSDRLNRFRQRRRNRRRVRRDAEKEMAERMLEKEITDPIEEKEKVEDNI